MMIILLISSLFAFPELGSQANYKYSDDKGNTAILNLELSDYNKETNEYLMEVHIDDSLKEREWLKESDFWSTKDFRAYYATCYKEEVTVIAGTFKACRIDVKDKTMWFYPLPFLLVLEKAKEDGKVVYRQLLDYK